MEEKLITAVGNHPILYDQSLYTYRDTNRRELAWREVSLEWLNACLRDRFWRERVKEREFQRSGAGATPRQPWRFMAVMGFLTPFLHDRGTTSNLQCGGVPVVHINGPPSSSDPTDVGSGEECGPAAVVAGVAAAPPEMEAGVPAAPAAAPAAAAAPPMARAGGQAPEGRGRKRRGPEMSTFERGLLAVMEPLAALASQPQPQPPWDEEEVFFRGLIPAMRRLSIPRRARVHYQIHQLVYRAEMEELDVSENG
ncbi:hypothetical protein N1851_030052 [Merluccius polli]|uniref:MADF domain-containing protein n=1 Tax=Merluccius polli TaxID=89951 RepID=A0AA47M662_MERPO|nr:hypothetical protein N1851_030052 [Merluccius polli]